MLFFFATEQDVGANVAGLVAGGDQHVCTNHIENVFPGCRMIFINEITTENEHEDSPVKIVLYTYWSRDFDE